MSAVWWVVSLVTAVCSDISPDLVVETTKGRVRGVSLPTVHDDRSVSAWLGVPYAQPPIGDGESPCLLSDSVYVQAT